MGCGVIGGGGMAEPDLAVIAEGDLPSGEHWILRAGGTSTEFGTFLETIHPDGRRDQGGMGGPNFRTDQGPDGRYSDRYSSGGPGPRRGCTLRAAWTLTETAVRAI
jgi:hypothetical protein